MGSEEEKRSVQTSPENGGKKKWLRIALVTAAALLAVSAIAVAVYWNSMLNLLGDPEETVPTMSQEELDALLNAAALEDTLPEETSPEDTWPVVVSDENITNIMLVGQNFREDEQNKLSDTMILCSINRETKTLTMVSILRDLYIKLPAYAGHGPGRNRINVCYALGSTWKRSSLGGMEMLAQCVEQNFGIHVDHTIEVGFDTFVNIVDTLGGVEVDVTEAEAQYMTDEVGYVGDIEPGLQILDGAEALAYARIRKIDSDRQRTVRQRTVITSLLDKCRNMGLMELHELATNVLPFIITDMSNEEITNYIWEFLPMAKDIQLRSITCPVDNETLPGSFWNKSLVIYGYHSDVVECNTTLNGQYIREALGLTELEE